jgi:SagB-type dehydrogenase family enzyme
MRTNPSDAPKFEEALPEKKIRRSPHLVMYWLGSKLYYDNYLTQTRIVADPLVCKLLDFFSTWRSLNDAIAFLEEHHTHGSIRRAIAQLLESALLIDMNSKELKLAKYTKAWDVWNSARYFHFSTKDVELINDPEAERQFYLRKFAQGPAPPIYKEYEESRRIQLPKQLLRRSRSFSDVLLERKTVRQFSREPLPLKELASLLYYTWGRTGYLKSKILGPLLKKTSPSHGARHPIEVYPIVLNVQGLNGGIYHYGVKDHCLQFLAEGEYGSRCIEYCQGQEWVGNAAVLFIMTSVFARSMWKYENARTYRAVLVDAGHLSQTMYLVATWMGLGPFCTGMTRDTLIEKDLGPDGVTESVVFVTGVGRLSRK